MKTLFLGAILALLAPCTLATQNPVIWSGGITIDEREAAPTEGVRLSFFLTTGHYLSAITVSVLDEAGSELVDTVTTGPWLILDLAPGRYTVNAQRQNGQVQSAMVEVTSGNQEFGIAFPAE
ncbi:MAG: hypothetical protein WD396_09870 [Pseudohongiellaceae bacterium]